MVNAALPHDWQLKVSNDRVSVPNSRYTRAKDGEIVVTFLPRERWTVAGEGCRNAIGCASSWGWDTGELTHGEVWIDHTRTDGRNNRLGVIVHEILHVLGRGHPDPYLFPESVMRPGVSENHGFILSQLDREALLAVYSRLDPGTAESDIYWRLGPWEDTSTVVNGFLDIPGGFVDFGAVEMNNHVQAWAYGPTPDTQLEDNPELSGSATWLGHLAGITPRAEAVAGAARLRVKLATLDGDLHFSQLESWSPGVAPGAVGTGFRWLDGDLNYPIEVGGDSFWRTWESGDEGIVNGSFFGVAHEGMGGVLKRDDLSAGFGGKR